MTDQRGTGSADNLRIEKSDKYGTMPSFLRGDIFLNGMKLNKVTDVDISMGVHDVSRVTITMICNVEIVEATNG